MRILIMYHFTKLILISLYRITHTELEIPWLDYENSMFFPNQKWCFKWFFEFPEVQLSPKTWFSPFTYPASRTVLLLLKSIKFPYRLLPVFDFYAGPSARGRQLYCRACNFKNVSALLAGNFYTCYVEPNDLPLLMDICATRFYSAAQASISGVFFWKLDLKNNQTILQHITFFISKPTLLLTLNIFIHRVLTEMLSVNKMVLTTCYLLYNVYGK